ncbi:sensor histidine kinase [Nocardia sp. IFM 10818]
MEESRSLARQSLLIAVTAAALDASAFLLADIADDDPLHLAALTFAIVAVDLWLAAPISTVLVVAVAQVAVRLAVVWGTGNLGEYPALLSIGMVVASYRVGAWTAGPVSIAALVLFGCGTAALHLLGHSRATSDWRLFLVMVVSSSAIPWMVGRFTTGQQTYIDELQHAARRQRERERRAVADAVVREREAIARDLHDVISHHVSAILMQAGLARMALTGAADPSVRQSLLAVESSSRAAMADLRRQLDLLHGRQPEQDSQPGLADIDGLLRSVRAAGLRVELRRTGDPVRVPESLDVALHRIVQELLTNMLRHGDGREAVLAIDQRPRRITIEAVNTVAPQQVSFVSGRGLDGIQQRVRLFCGSAQFGLDDSGHRWRGVVHVPLGAQ